MSREDKVFSRKLALVSILNSLAYVMTEGQRYSCWFQLGILSGALIERNIGHET